MIICRWILISKWRSVYIRNYNSYLVLLFPSRRCTSISILLVYLDWVTMFSSLFFIWLNSPAIAQSMNDLQVPMPEHAEHTSSPFSPSAQLTYERLVELEDVKVGLPIEYLDLLREENMSQYLLLNEHSLSESPSCSICFCEFENSEVIRQLPCQHWYHDECITRVRDACTSFSHSLCVLEIVLPSLSEYF